MFPETRHATNKDRDVGRTFTLGSVHVSMCELQYDITRDPFHSPSKGLVWQMLDTI